MIIMLKLNKAKQLVKFVEFCCDGKQINLKRFFSKYGQNVGQTTLIVRSSHLEVF